MLSNKRLVLTCAVVFCCNLSILIVFVRFNIDDKCYISINEHQHVTTILPEDFLSVGIDTSQIQNFKRVDFGNSRLRDLAAALAPARLRLGGTMSDRLIFSTEDIGAKHITCKHCHVNGTSLCHSIREYCKHKFLPFFIMTGNKFAEINEFCKAAKVKLLFSLNVLIRDSHGWNNRNAIELINFAKKKKFHVDWQLGNEPNSFEHVFNISIPPHNLTLDFKKLHTLLHDLGYKSWIVGPDTTRPLAQRKQNLQYMIDFLEKGSRYINARSWHQYYVDSRTATLEDFWNPDTLDLLKEQIETMKNHTKKYNYIPMWLTETSSSFGGGAEGLSDSYAGSPLWLDKLGLAAKYNITTVVRQSFIGGNYSLVSEDLEPLPDWWISVLFKKVVGNKVLRIDCKCSQFQRIYAHCTNRKYTNDTTAVTIYGVNLEMNKVRFFLNGSALHTNNLDIDEYIVSAPSNNRKTKTVLLNGWPLYYESPLPDLQPHHIYNRKYIAMPPYSIGFWVIKNTSIKICK